MRLVILDKFKNESTYKNVSYFKIRKHKLFIYFHEHAFFVKVVFNLSYVVRIESFII